MISEYDTYAHKHVVTECIEPVKTREQQLNHKFRIGSTQPTITQQIMKQNESIEKRESRQSSNNVNVTCNRFQTDREIIALLFFDDYARNSGVRLLNGKRIREFNFASRKSWFIIREQFKQELML